MLVNVYEQTRLMKSNELRLFQQIDKTGEAIPLKPYQTETSFENG